MFQKKISALPPKNIVLMSHGESGIGSFLGKGQATKMVGHVSCSHKKENYDIPLSNEEALLEAENP